MVISLILESLGIGIMIPLLSSLFGNAEGFFFINNFLYLEKFQSINKTDFFILLTIIVFLIKNLFLTFNSWCQEKFVANLEINTTMRLFNCYLYKDYIFLLQSNIAQLIRNVKEESGSFSEMLKQINIFISEVLIAFGIIIILMLIDFYSTLVILISLVIPASIIYLLNKKKMARRGTEEIILNGKINKLIIQGLSAAKDVKILNTDNNLSKSLNQVVKDKVNINFFVRFLISIPRFIFEIIIVFLLLGLVYFYLTQNKSPQDIIVQLGVFGVAAIRLVPATNKIFSSFQGIRFKIPVLDLIHNELVINNNEMKDQNDRTINKDLTFKDSITLTDVDFQYLKKDTKVLTGLNLTLRKNKIIGIIGETGSGKTTLINIICGLIKPSNGKILIDGKDVSKSINSWQKKISYVPQSVYLIDDTVINNVAFGVDQNNINIDKVKSALKTACLDREIENLPNGLNTILGERGLSLSGGQQQRMGIARSIYFDKEIIIFDEATNALDKDTEKKLISEIFNLKNKTIIIITHEPSITDNCDQIFLINNRTVIKKK